MEIAVDIETRGLDYKLLNEEDAFGQGVSGAVAGAAPSAINEVFQQFGSIISPFMIGWKLIGMFLKALIPLPITSAGFSGLEKLAATGLTLFRWYLTFVIILEIYFIFINRKTH